MSLTRVQSSLKQHVKPLTTITQQTDSNQEGHSLVFLISKLLLDEQLFALE